MKHQNLIIAFDFDNTIKSDSNFHHAVIELLKECKEKGMTLILFTVETSPSKLLEKKNFCIENGFEPDFINESPIFRGSSKPYYNILLDDRAGLQSSFYVLKIVINKIF
jgi:hypothetical protein